MTGCEESLHESITVKPVEDSLIFQDVLLEAGQLALRRPHIHASHGALCVYKISGFFPADIEAFMKIARVLRIRILAQEGRVP